jgi:cyclopropane fatty-acyl-phospholipid synthase-like methyltransferase
MRWQYCLVAAGAWICLGLTLQARVLNHATPQGTDQAGQMPPDHMEHRFDNPEASAKSFDDPARDLWQMPERVIDALGLKTGQTVADLGAGTGYFTVRLARSKAAPLVYAVDVEEAMVKYVRERAAKEGLANVVAVQASADRANLPAPVDLVLIVDTYHHLPNRVAYFTELRKMMKASARLAIIDYRKGAPGGPPEEFRHTPAQIGDELVQAGFTLETQHDFLPQQLFLIFRMTTR